MPALNFQKLKNIQLLITMILLYFSQVNFWLNMIFYGWYREQQIPALSALRKLRQIEQAFNTSLEHMYIKNSRATCATPKNVSKSVQWCSDQWIVLRNTNSIQNPYSSLLKVWYTQEPYFGLTIITFVWDSSQLIGFNILNTCLQY